MFSSSLSNEDGVSLLKLGFISENFHKAELTLHPWIRISFLVFPGRPKGLLFDLRCICLDLSFIETRAHYVALTGLELKSIWLCLPKCWI